ncbi:MAG: LacI family DNA-binding transcriptional regulator [Spirochaetota bacterium]
MRVTIKDIAELAGVSKTTVSFAFNEPSRISVDTREKVLSIARQHGYVPDPVARTMSSKRIGTIGLLLPQSIQLAFGNRYLAQILRGLGAACETEQYSLTLIPPIQGSLDSSVRVAPVDGLVTLGLLPSTNAAATIRQRHIPFVAIDIPDDLGIPSVCIDDERAAYTLMRYVLDLGHRRISVLLLGSLDQDPIRDDDSEPEMYFSGAGVRRMKGIEDAFHEEGLSTRSPSVQCIPTESTFDAGVRAGRLLFGFGSDRPTAVVTMCDEVALGVYQAANECNIRIPQDVSIAGFDGIPEGTLLTPPLTTIVQPGYEKGEHAGRLLLSAIHGKAFSTRPMVIETRLRVGGSTMPPGSK